MLTEYTIKLPKIKPTDAHFINDIAELYKNDIISPRKTAIDTINELNLDICDISNFDLKMLLKQYFPNIIYNLEGSILAYKLIHNHKSKTFYDYYNERFLDGSSVYIIIDKEKNNLMSNCDLLNLYMGIVQGIDELEVENKTLLYKHYLNNIYMFNFAYSLERRINAE